MSGLMPGAEPVFIEGNKTGLLFIHGFTASPYEGKYIAERLHGKSGLTVSVPLLPGHGTNPDDLRDKTWKDWYNFVEEKLLELKESCTHVFVCGQSMGAAMALRLAVHQTFQGVICLAGAVFLKDWRLILLPLARRMVTYHYKSKGGWLPIIINPKVLISGIKLLRVKFRIILNIRYAM
jgi:carboxylesterase